MIQESALIIAIPSIWHMLVEGTVGCGASLGRTEERHTQSDT